MDPRVSDILKFIPPQARLPEVVLPGKDSAMTCSGLWFREGYACDEHRLREAVTEDKRRLEEAETEFLDVLGRMARVAELAKDDLAKVQTSKASWALQLDQAKLVEIKRNSDVCWREIALIRAKAVCTTCSGKNYEYYLHRLGGISIQDCSIFLLVCHNFFWDVQQIGTAAGVLNYFLSQANMASTKYADILNNPNSHLDKALATLYRQYADLNEPAMTPQQLVPVHLAKAKMCQGMISIRNQSILQRYTSYLKKLVDAVEVEYRSLKNGQNYVQGSSTSRSSASVQPRIQANHLQTSPPVAAPQAHKRVTSASLKLPQSSAKLSPQKKSSSPAPIQAPAKVVPAAISSPPSSSKRKGFFRKLLVRVPRDLSGYYDWSDSNGFSATLQSVVVVERSHAGHFITVNNGMPGCKPMNMSLVF